MRESWTRRNKTQAPTAMKLGAEMAEGAPQTCGTTDGEAQTPVGVPELAFLVEDALREKDRV